MIYVTYKIPYQHRLAGKYRDAEFEPGVLSLVTGTKVGYLTYLILYIYLRGLE